MYLLNVQVSNFHPLLFKKKNSRFVAESLCALVRLLVCAMQPFTFVDAGMCQPPSTFLEGKSPLRSTSNPFLACAFLAFYCSLSLCSLILPARSSAHAPLFFLAFFSGPALYLTPLPRS